MYCTYFQTLENCQHYTVLLTRVSIEQLNDKIHCVQKRDQKYFLYITLPNAHVSLQFLASNIASVLKNY